MQPKFKIGDIVHDPSDEGNFKFKIVKIAKKGEEVFGKWYDSTKSKVMPVDSYIVEGYRSGICFILGFDHEQYYKLVSENTGKQCIKYSPKDYPHKCPYCKSPAYVGVNNVDCSSNCEESQ